MNKEAFAKAFQKQLAESYQDGYQAWWHKYLFHFSDINNVISILNSGRLYSRNRALELGLMQNDNADDDVIEHTTLDAKDYVRFYFGALTPTQYHNEGFKPQNRITNNAHCPVPVFLLFDFVSLLSHQKCRFSSGNIAASGVDIYSDIQDLERLEFEYIYHRGSLYNTPNASHITYCRHAEVLLPHELGIWDALRFVVVRSEAEKQTLMYHLRDDVVEKIADKIRVRTNGLFYANRLYVKEVNLVDNGYIITFSRTTVPDRFNFRFIVTNCHTGESIVKEAPQVMLENAKPKLLIDGDLRNSILRIEINEHLAYEHDFSNLSHILV